MKMAKIKIHYQIGIIFTHDISGKELIFKIYKALTKLSSKKTPITPSRNVKCGPER